MHRAWQIDDILYLVLEQLDATSLSRLAQTCNALFDPATDELWKTITSIEPFLCCFRENYRRRPLERDEVHRLDWYASKVQILRIESESVKKPIRLPPPFRRKGDAPDQPGYKTWAEVWEEVASLRPQSDFFPNLRRLRINNVFDEILLPLRGISGTQLRYVYVKYIHGAKPDGALRDFLHKLGDTPNLEYLFVRDGGPDLIPPGLIQHSPLKHLRLDPRVSAHQHGDPEFKSFPLRAEIFEKKSLEHLTLGLTREWWSPEVAALQGRYLPLLKTLWLNLITLEEDYDRIQRSKTGQQGWKRLSDRPATEFVKGLDNPELTLLNIKFPISTTSSMLLEMARAARDSCRLQSLTELGFAGGGYFHTCWECNMRPSPKIDPESLRKALKTVLPLPQLQTLRLSVAPNFLDVLDLDMYASITAGLQALKRLWLGHGEFMSSSLFLGTRFDEHVPLRHLAAFCHMLPKLTEVSVGALDSLTPGETFHQEWASPGVTSLKVPIWVGREVPKEHIHEGIRTYFPNSNLAGDDFDPSIWSG